MRISKGNSLVAIVLFFLLSRVVIDTAWPETKPMAIVSFYTMFGFLLSLYFLAKGKSDGKIIPLLVFVFPCTLLASQLVSSVDLLAHIKFALQVFIPCLFLVAATSMPCVMHKTSKLYNKYFSLCVLLVLMLASYISYKQSALPGEGFYQHYQNSPNHVIAQTLLKASLPLITSGVFWVSLTFALVFILNVRSVILAYFMNLVFVHRNMLWRKSTFKKILIFGAPLLAIAIAQIDWIDVYNRVVFKGRDTADAASLADSATSGRLGIYQMYISYMADSFGFSEWLLGVGPIWLQPDGPALSAHNDVLNLLVSFGILGLLGTLSCYFYFYTKLSPTGKLIFSIAFAVLSLTNGVVFHQSNILFVLLYFFNQRAAQHPVRS